MAGLAEAGGGGGGADNPKAVGGLEGDGGGVVEEFAVALEGYDVGAVVAAHVGRGQGLADQWGGGSEFHAGETEVVEPGCIGLRRRVDVHYANYGLNLLVGADYADHIAGEDACVAAGHYDECASALYHHDADAVLLAYAAVDQTLAYKRAAVAHADVGQMEVVDEVVVFARAPQLALVEVVEESRFELPELPV